jgi:hypothetical protein
LLNPGNENKEIITSSPELADWTYYSQKKKGFFDSPLEPKQRQQYQL